MKAPVGPCVGIFASQIPNFERGLVRRARRSMAHGAFNVVATVRKSFFKNAIIYGSHHYKNTPRPFIRASGVNLARQSLHKKPVKTAVIVTKVYKKPVSGAITDIAKMLEGMGVRAYIDQSTAVGLENSSIEPVSKKQMKDKDLIIVVGGDGSVLGAARTLIDLRIPVLGVNRGHLGLLTDVSVNDMQDAFAKVVEGRYYTEKRMMLSVSVHRQGPGRRSSRTGIRSDVGPMVGRSLATNETVIHSGMMAHMMNFNVTIDANFMYSLRGDGMIVNTPTGSTAYSLSAGGPIIEPRLDVLSLVPMFPQSLNCSPIIIPGRSVVRIDFQSPDDTAEWVNVSCDGQVTIRADTRCTVLIKQHHTPLILMHPEGYDYYEVLRQKLGWGQCLV